MADRGTRSPALVDPAAAEARAAAEAAAERDAVHAAARAEGLAAGRAELADALASVAAMAEDLAAARRTLEDDVVAGAARLALEVAAKVVRAELSTRPELVVQIVQAAIRRASERERLVVRVHPDDLERCRGAAPEIAERMGGISSLRIVDEPRVTPGGCVVETSGGDVDATLETQLARIAEAVCGPPDEALT